METEKLLQDKPDADNHAAETVMLERLLDKVKAFYKNPKNIQAFTAWKENKEETLNGTSTNHI